MSSSSSKNVILLMVLPIMFSLGRRPEVEDLHLGNIRSVGYHIRRTGSVPDTFTRWSSIKWSGGAGMNEQDKSKYRNGQSIYSSINFEMMEYSLLEPLQDWFSFSLEICIFLWFFSLHFVEVTIFQFVLHSIYSNEIFLFFPLYHLWHI